MKRVTILLLVVSLLLTVSGSAFGRMMIFKAGNVSYDFIEGGMFQTLFGDYAKLNSWYSIKPDESYFQADYYDTSSNSSMLKLKYYQNDQTFAQYIRYDSDGVTNFFSASYLFDFGLFLGGVFDDKDDDGFFIPGYRWNFGDNGYVAVKYLYDTDESDGYAYVLNGKYYNDQFYFKGSYLKLLLDEDSIMNFGLNYRITDTLVAGFNYARVTGYDAYEAGLTWGNDDTRWIVDATLGRDASETNYGELSGMVEVIDNLRLGAELETAGSDGYDDIITLKAGYDMENNRLAFKYILENDDYDARFILVYNRKF
jgi:hypothetical protein